MSTYQLLNFPRLSTGSQGYWVTESFRQRKLPFSNEPRVNRIQTKTQSILQRSSAQLRSVFQPLVRTGSCLRFTHSLLPEPPGVHTVLLIHFSRPQLTRGIWTGRPQTPNLRKIHTQKYDSMTQKKKKKIYHTVEVRIPQWTNKPFLFSLFLKWIWKHGNPKLKAGGDARPNALVTKNRLTNHTRAIMSLDPPAFCMNGLICRFYFFPLRWKVVPENETPPQ